MAMPIAQQVPRTSPTRNKPRWPRKVKRRSIRLTPRPKISRRDPYHSHPAGTRLSVANTDESTNEAGPGKNPNVLRGNAMLSRTRVSPRKSSILTGKHAISHREQVDTHTVLRNPPTKPSKQIWRPTSTKKHQVIRQNANWKNSLVNGLRRPMQS